MQVSPPPGPLGTTQPRPPEATPKLEEARENPDEYERGSTSSDPARRFRVAGHITMAASMAALVGLSPIVGIAPAVLLAVTGQALLLKGGYSPTPD